MTSEKEHCTSSTGALLQAIEAGKASMTALEEEAF